MTTDLELFNVSVLQRCGVQMPQCGLLVAAPEHAVDATS